MDTVRMKAVEEYLLQEMIPALGCTEPIAIALACARAARALEEPVERIDLSLSRSVIKNANSVVVPNARGGKGIAVAAALGVTGGNPDAGLEVLESVTEDDATAARILAESGAVAVTAAEDVPLLYVSATVHGKNHTARAVYEGAHDRLGRLERDGEVLYEQPLATEAEEAPDLTLKEILAFAETIYLKDHPRLVQRLDEMIDNNLAIADEGMRSVWGQQIGRTVLDGGSDRLENKLKAYAAAGSDARMSGCSLPVTINAGSGNQGITVSVPVILFAKETGVSKDAMYRALLISNLVSLHQKWFIGKLSAFCGAVSASAGAGAGIGWLKGMSEKELGDVITNVLATGGGIVCDGAKPSCAAKISVALEAALLAICMVEKGQVFQEGDGIVGSEIEDTIHRIGRMASEGMKSTDRVIVEILTETGADGATEA